MSAAVVIKQPKKAPDGTAWRELFRYANGKWVKADGAPDVAFGGKSERGYPYAIALATRDGASDHPANIAARKASEWVCGRYHCANGRRVRRDGRYA